MCYESSRYQKQRDVDELAKAKREADALIEQARTAERKPSVRTPAETVPAAEAEKIDA